MLFCVWQVHAQVSDFKKIKFDKADRIAAEHKHEKLNNLPVLVYTLTNELDTDVEKFRAIFTWVCSNISNDYQLYAKNMRKRRKLINDSIALKAWNEKFKKIVFKKLRKRKKTLCTGYAYLIKKMANLAEIECEIVHGFAKTSTIDPEKLTIPNHSWNAVKLNGKWYLCDPTWASGIPNPESYQFQFHYNEGFFLADPQIFAINHFPLKEKWFLLTNNTSQSFQSFIEAPILYNDAYRYFSSHSKPAKMYQSVQQNDSLTLAFDTYVSFQKKDVHFIIENSFTSKRRMPSFISLENQKLCVAYKFTTSGYYDVHLYVKDDLISTYTVEVKKD